MKLYKLLPGFRNQPNDNQKKFHFRNNILQMLLVLDRLQVEALSEKQFIKVKVDVNHQS
jgi:hypothetical protein